MIFLKQQLPILIAKAEDSIYAQGIVQRSQNVAELGRSVISGRVLAFSVRKENLINLELIIKEISLKSHKLFKLFSFYILFGF